MSYSLEFKNLFIESCATIGGKKEYEGPIGQYLDNYIKTSYNKQKKF